MKRLIVNTLGFATAFVTLSGLAMAEDQSQGLKLMSGNAELIQTLSTKSAKQGQAVAVKLTGAIKTPEGAVLPRGTELLGQVSEVKPSDNKGSSTLALTFNQARLKDGKVLAIKATLIGVAPADGSLQLPTAVAADDAFDQLAGAISGVELHSAVKEEASGTLTGDHRNIDLRQGTQFMVAVGVESTPTSSAAE